MARNIENIVVVGGGTAGWLAAAYLNRALNRAGQTGCNITLIESAAIGVVGVGEATVPNLRRTLGFLGLEESEWMIASNATFKLAIKFVNWSGLPGREVFWHPFGPIPAVDGFALAHHWLKRRLAGQPEPFDSSCYSTVALCQAGKSPKRHEDPDYEGQAQYAYHLDASLLANYLKKKCQESGVKRIVDNVVEVVLDQNGFINHLKTEKNGNLSGDLFIDCTGFRGLLINQALSEPFISYSDCLFCDNAVAMAVPYPTRDNRQPINPYTTATALSAGWVWQIPLFNRSGDGYVYSSAFLSKEAAEAELRAHLGQKSAQVEANHIKMRVGRTRNAWVKNCVSIGLSSGFIEPLESTGIYLIEIGLYNLIHYFPDKNFEPALVRKYNRVMQHYYEHIRDFIVLHYCLTQRQDTPFWQANKHHPAIPETLQTKLALWKAIFPLQEDLFNPGLFGNQSYVCLLAGMDYLPQRGLPILDYFDAVKATEAFQTVKAEVEHLKHTLPDHDDYLRWLRLYDTLRQGYRQGQQPQGAGS